MEYGPENGRCDRWSCASQSSPSGFALAPAAIQVERRCSSAWSSERLEENQCLRIQGNCNWPIRRPSQRHSQIVLSSGSTPINRKGSMPVSLTAARTICADRKSESKIIWGISSPRDLSFGATTWQPAGYQFNRAKSSPELLTAIQVPPDDSEGYIAETTPHSKSLGAWARGRERCSSRFMPTAYPSLRWTKERVHMVQSARGNSHAWEVNSRQ